MVVVENLRRAFGPIMAVNDISFRAECGEVLGILGPNGAGKTTAMRMLAGYLQPDSGSASICGHDVVADSLKSRRSLGYLPENVPLYGEMTVLSFLRFICSARGLGSQEGRTGIDRVAELCSIGPVMHQTIETLSKGYKRRVGLAQALVHDPPVLILDEPTDGLDPNQKYDVRQLITRMSRTKCILISTHILEEVQAICTRAIIVAGGSILADATPRQIAEKYGGDLEEAFRRITNPSPAGLSSKEGRK